MPATVFSPPGETVWTTAEGKAAAHMPLFLTLSPAALTTAPGDGYYRPVCDGLEAVWDTPSALTYSPSDVLSSLSVKPSAPAKAKLEEGFERYFLFLVQTGTENGKNGCIPDDNLPGDSDSDDNVPESRNSAAQTESSRIFSDTDKASFARIVDLGNDPSVTLPEDGQTCLLKTAEGLTIRAVLLSREREGDCLLLRFSSPASPSLAALPRVMSAALCLDKKIALSVPASALLSDGEGQACVLCDRGDRAVARAVDVMTSDSTEALCTATDKKTLLFGQSLPYLRAGDRVITDPAGLTHRSLLHRKRDPFSYLRYIIQTEKQKKEDTP